MKFKTGVLTMTKGINEKIKTDDRFIKFISESLGKYIYRDWGDSCDEDKKTNDDALEHGERIFAAYIEPETREKI